jgi:hypothetical protein
VPETRSFQLSTYSPPKKNAADYSEAEKEKFRAAFEPIAEKNRAYNYISIGAACVAAIIFIIFRNNVWPWGVAGLVAFNLLYYFWLYRTACPACGRKTDDRIRTFCPICGGKIIPGNGSLAPECLSCGKGDSWFGKRRRRLYKIKHCTHCGIFLDEQGF